MGTVSTRVSDLSVRSTIGRWWQFNRFRQHHTPTLQVTVVNLAGEEVYVEIEITTESSIIEINNAAQPWRAEREIHGGQNSRGKRRWSYKLPLRFTGTDPNKQNILIRIYKGPRGVKANEALPQVEEMRHAIWVK
jgi:hypothetical protein